MFNLPFVLLVATAYVPDISIYDSRTDKSKVWMLIDDCPVELDKSKLNNIKYVEKQIKNVCHMDLDLPNEI